jgi:hypothetical protein
VSLESATTGVQVIDPQASLAATGVATDATCSNNVVLPLGGLAGATTQISFADNSLVLPLDSSIDALRGSDLESLPRQIVTATPTPASGTLLGVACMARRSFTTTKVRVHTGNTPTGLTANGTYLALYDAASPTAPIAQTADLSATINAGPNTYTPNWVTPVAITKGHLYILAFVSVSTGTAVSVSAVNLSTSALAGTLAGTAPQLSYSVPGFTAGSALPSLVGAAAGSTLPWIEAI